MGSHIGNSAKNLYPSQRRKSRRKRNVQKRMKSKKKHKKNITNSTYVGGSVKKIKKKRKNYPVENLNHALEAIKRGAPIKRAAAVYGIPVATLFRKHKNPDAINKKPGPKTYLPESVEKDIVNWIVVRAQVGDPVTKAQLFDAVQKYVTDTKLKTPFINNRPNKHWYQSFRKRHPNISIRKPQKLSHTRASVTQEDLKQWFEEVAEFLKEKDVFGIGADRYFNCDETSLPLSPESDVVLANKGSLNVYQVGDDGKQCVTVLSVYSASGMRAPPMVMFSYKHTIPKGILEKLPEGWGVGNSDSGWQTSETFYEYMTNVFNPWIEKQSIPKPVVMFLDNHSSHLTPPLITWCRENKIELIGLLPNSTHLIQPLDIAFFHPFKLEWKRTLLKWKNERCTTTLKKEDISIVINETLNNMKNEKQIVINGFRAAGLFPFDPKAVDFNVLNKKKKGKKTLDQQVETSENIEQHLKMFETRLNPDLVVQFKEAEQNGVWMGDEKFTGLFEYWLSCHKGQQFYDVNTSASIVRIDNVPVNVIDDVQKNSLETNNNDYIHVSECMNLSDSQDLINLDNVPIILSKTPLSNTFEYEITDIESANLDCENNYSVTCSSINTSQTEKEENSFSKNILKETDTNKLQISKTPIQSHIPKDDSINQTLDQGINQSLNDNNENNAPLVKKCINDKNVFASSFPVKYLPAKKKKKIEASGKPKPPVAGTSDIYYNYITEKEKQKEVKDEQSESKKKLTSQKQILMKKKQKLIEDIRICAEKIKQEESDEIKKNLYKEQKKLVDEKYDIEIKITNLQKQISNLMFENKIVE